MTPTFWRDTKRKRAWTRLKLNTSSYLENGQCTGYIGAEARNRQTRCGCDHIDDDALGKVPCEMMYHEEGSFDVDFL